MITLVALSLVLAPVEARADGCAIEGMASGITITVRRERGYQRVRLEQPTRVAIAPVRNGLWSVRTGEGEQAIEGTTQTTLPIVLARAVSLREQTVELPAGLAIERVRASAGPWATIDLALGDDLYLRRAEVPCSALAIAPAEGVTVTALAPLDARGPAWRARTTRVQIFDERDGDRSMRLEVAPGGAIRFVELDRRVPWVRIVARTSLGARLRGWMRDWDLVR